MHYVGIDLHKKYLTVCALNKSGEVMAEHRRLANTAEAVLGMLGELEGPVAAARKLCCYLYWMLKAGWSYEEWLQQHGRSEVRPVQTLASVA